MAGQHEALVLGIGNLLWADEGFGVRAVEALHAAFAFPAGVTLKDGGTLGLSLYDDVTAARRVLVLDAVDFGLAPGSLVVLRGDDVPAWGRTKLSPHQLGFNDVLALAQLNGRAPETVVAIGVQPVELGDFGGSLRPAVRDRIPEAVALAERELASWGLPGVARAPDAVCEPLNATALALPAYESGRPDERAACRDGDPRVLVRAAPRQPAMCIGIPMRVVAVDGVRARCEGRGETQDLDCMLVEAVAPGAWVLAFRGAAVRVLSAAEAAATNDALDALAAVLAGDVAAGFADLVDREPVLPPHLRGDAA